MIRESTFLFFYMSTTTITEIDDNGEHAGDSGAA
jgi:hypothetical protein